MEPELMAQCNMDADRKEGDEHTDPSGAKYVYRGTEWLRLTNTPRATDAPGSSDRTPTAKSSQVGGTHYTDMAIQPIEYILANGIGFTEGNVIKYVSRWQSKGGVQDLKKARHMLDILITHEEKGGA